MHFSYGDAENWHTPGRLPHLRSDNPPQPLVARHPEHVTHPIAFAPAHQLLRQKPESPRKTIFTSGQAARICSTIRRISAKLPAAASLLDWQVAIALLIAMEEAPLLLPMQRKVRGIHI